MVLLRQGNTVLHEKPIAIFVFSVAGLGCKGGMVWGSVEGMFISHDIIRSLSYPVATVNHVPIVIVYVCTDSHHTVSINHTFWI